MRGVPLGTLVYRSGLVSLDDLQAALKDAVVSGRRLGEVLLSSGALTPADLAMLLAGQNGLTFMDEVPARDPEAEALLDPHRSRELGAAVIGFEDGRPLVVVTDPSDASISRVRATLGRDVSIAVVGPATLERLLTPEPVQPPVPEPPAAAEAQPAPPPRATRAFVELRLHGGHQVDLASYASREQAESVANEARRRLGAGERLRLGDRVLDGSMVEAVEVFERAVN
jgi:hypothetical protein